jgi:hypothetical protein
MLASVAIWEGQGLRCAHFLKRGSLKWKWFDGWDLYQ